MSHPLIVYLDWTSIVVYIAKQRKSALFVERRGMEHATDSSCQRGPVGRVKERQKREIREPTRQNILSALQPPIAGNSCIAESNAAIAFCNAFSTSICANALNHVTSCNQRAHSAVELPGCRKCNFNCRILVRLAPHEDYNADIIAEDFCNSSAHTLIPSFSAISPPQ